VALRVTGGVHRSRLLAAPRGRDTRPTSDRVREALFSILAADADAPLEGARVLDLYAGTGALGIEALSRGASSAVFVERGRDALAALRENLTALGLDEEGVSHVVGAPVSRALATLVPPAGGFTLVFCDPPYALVGDGSVGRTLAALPPLLGPDARIVLEHASADAPPPLERTGLSLQESRKYGDTALALYRFVSLPPA